MTWEMCSEGAGEKDYVSKRKANLLCTDTWGKGCGGGMKEELILIWHN